MTAPVNAESNFFIFILYALHHVICILLRAKVCLESKNV